MKYVVCAGRGIEMEARICSDIIIKMSVWQMTLLKN